MRLLQSASKLVFIMMAATACVGFFFGKIEAKDFLVLAVSAFSYYFGQKVPKADATD